MSADSLVLPTDSIDPEIVDENLFGISVVSDVLDASVKFIAESCSSEGGRPCSQPDEEEERPCSVPDEEEERPCSQPDEEEERPCSMPDEEEERPCSMDEGSS